MFNKKIDEKMEVGFMTEVTISSIETKTKKDGSGSFYVAKFSPDIDGKSSATAWDLDKLGGAKVGNLVDMATKANGIYLNVLGCKVIKETSDVPKPEFKSRMSFEELTELYGKCKAFVIDCYKEDVLNPNVSPLLDITAAVHTLFISAQK